MAARIEIPTTFTAIDKYSRVVSKMTKGVSKWGKQGVAAVQRFDTKISRTFKKMGRLTQMALGVGLGAIFLSAIQNNIAYEDSLASVSAITGAVGEDLVLLEKLSKNTASTQKMLGKDVLKAYELIGSAKPELLENANLLDEVTNAAITLSKAGRMELAPASEALTTTLNQFSLGGEKALSVIDYLAAGAKFGSSAITQTSEALSKFGTIAAATGSKVDESIALIELVSPFEKGAEAGTKLRNILGKMAGAKILPEKALKVLKKAGVDIDIVTNKSLPLGERLKEMSKLGGNATDVMQVFGTENAALAQGIFTSIGKYDGMLSKIRETGVAHEQATTNSNTFKFAIESIKTSFLNLTTANQSQNKTLDLFKRVLMKVAENMDTVLIIIGSLIGAYILMKTVIIASKVATFAWNVAIGINTALTQTNKRAVIGNAVAQGTYKVVMAAGVIATGAMTAAQWLLNIALDANPVGLVILAIVAMIFVLYAVTQRYDEWGASITFLLGPFGMVINLVESFKRNWDMVKQSFKDGGIISGLHAIGRVIVESTMMPLQQVLEMIAKIPGMSGVANGLAEKIENFRANLGVKMADETENNSVSDDESPLPSIAQASSSFVSNIVKQSNIDINIKDPGNNVERVESNAGSDIPINMTNTVGAN